MLSASDMPVPDATSDSDPNATDVVLLPAWKLISGVTPALVPELISTYINTSPTNTTPLPTSPASTSILSTAASAVTDAAITLVSLPHPATASKLTARPLHHDYLILLCSQKTRDARCGQSAPLLRRELERHLRPLGLYRDLHDTRPGGCGIYFISHVGGHKYAANVLVFRRQGRAGTGSAKGSEQEKEAAQCIWLGRIRPEDCENLVRYTVMQGKVVKPEKQLRGGWDRSRGVVSW
jgi:hypothetical protein